MIHSLCGGKLRDNQSLDIVKVKFINNPLALDRPYWYKSEIVGLKAGDKVIAPFGKSEEGFVAEVLRVDRGVNEQNCPFNTSKMQYIISKAE